MSHEIVQLFDAAERPLAKQLCEMLDEHPSHRTERRGCGYTQATRFVATYINQPIDPCSCSDLGVFQDWPQRETGIAATLLQQAGWEEGWRNLDQAPEHVLERVHNERLRAALVGLAPLVRSIGERVSLPESRLLIGLIEHLLTRRAPEAPDIPAMAEKPNIGSCSQAEEFFLEIAHGRVRRGGSVNVIVDADGEPVMLEKMNLGESHSAFVVAPIRISGVRIPPGGLCALEHRPDGVAGTPTAHGLMLPLSNVARARFLRLTTLTLPPRERQRAFSAQIDAQIRSRMLSPTTTTLEELQDFARLLRQSRRAS